MSVAASAVLLLALAGLGGLAVWRLDRRCRQWARRARRLAVRAGDAELRVEQQQRLAEMQRRAEHAVEQTNAAVRAIHKGIARIPFGLLSRIQATRKSARVAQTVHDSTSEVVYESISAVNRLVGTQIRRGLRQDDETALETAPILPPTSTDRDPG